MAVVDEGGSGVSDLYASARSASPSPTQSATIVKNPAGDPIETAGALVAIVLALAAGVLGYKIIRGGRGI